MIWDRLLKVAVLVCCVTNFAEVVRAAPQKLKYIRDNVTYELTAEAKKGDGPYGVNINYSIKEGGKKLENWYHQSQFILRGCDDHGIPKQFASVATDGKEDLGFLLYSGCGNPFTGIYHFVYGKKSFKSVTVISKASKYPPVFRASDAPDIIEMWTVEQRYPNGVGTAMSIFVPIVTKISRTDEYLSRDRRRPPEKISSWPALDYVTGFPSFFAAGLTMMDDRILTQAVDIYFKPTESKDYEALGLPASKEEASRVIEAVKTLRQYYENYPPVSRQ